MVQADAHAEVGEIDRDHADAPPAAAAADRIPACRHGARTASAIGCLVVAGLGHLLRLRRQERAVPAARLVARRDGRPDAGLGPRALGDDGGRRRVSGRPVLIRCSRRKCCWSSPSSAHHAVPRGDDRHHRRPTSSACWPTRTVSQLGYMMLALGVGGWVAGLFHLITHAFFKSLLVHVLRLGDSRLPHQRHDARWAACGTKMPWTAYTMLVGCLAIAGAGIPFVDRPERAITRRTRSSRRRCSFREANPQHAILFCVAAGGAAITAFYMFRLWFMTFAGQPRDQHVYEHAHESPPVMYVPLVVLAVFAVGSRLADSWAD